MRKALSLFIGVLSLVYSQAQEKDCWVFIEASHDLNDTAGIVCEASWVGKSLWFHAWALSDIMPSNWKEYSWVDSLVCYDQQTVPVILASDTTDSLHFQDSSFHNMGVISESDWNDSTLIIPEEQEWEYQEWKELKYEQIELMKGYEFINNGLAGNGITIAVLDAGFEGLVEDSVFSYLISDDRIIDTYDFVKKDKDVFHYSNHGTQVMSCIAGLMKDDDLEYKSPLGLAPCSRFLLARAEQSYSGRLVKEVNFINALEWAVSKGANIITSSLIFGEQLYTRNQMNGKSLISQAAEKAFYQNVLVLNSAGNADQNHWEIVGAPGDAEHVLAIGACTWNGLKSSFSSVGPTVDWRMKPDLIARGNVFVSSNNDFTMESGTSFACPLVSGFAACVWEMHPDWSAAKLREELVQSASLYPYFDYAHGYGIPQAGYFLYPSVELPKDSTPFHLEFLSDQVVEVIVHASIVSDSADISLGLKEESELESERNESLAEHGLCTDLIYVSILDRLGHIMEYWTVQPEGVKGGLYDISGNPGGKLRVYYKKYIQEIDLR